MQISPPWQSRWGWTVAVKSGGVPECLSVPPHSETQPSHRKLDNPILSSTTTVHHKNKCVRQHEKPADPPTRTKASRFLPPPSSTRVPHYRFISLDNEDSYSTLHKKKGPEWEPRRGSGQRKVIEKTSIWLWHLHTGEITAVTVDWSEELSSLDLWVIFPALDLCSMFCFVFFFLFL